MAEGKNKSQENSLMNKLVVPIIIAIVAGGTSPWWVNLFKKDLPSSKQEEKPQIDDSVKILGNNNSFNDNSVKVSGSNNSVNIDKESDAKSKGEFAIPFVSGMNYHEARKKIIDEGWTPLTQRWFYSNDPNIQGGNGQVFWEDGYWEIVSCTGTAEAFCRFEFSDPSNRRLVVITAGQETGEYKATINRVFLENQ